MLEGMSHRSLIHAQHSLKDSKPRGWPLGREIFPQNEWLQLADVDTKRTCVGDLAHLIYMKGDRKLGHSDVQTFPNMGAFPVVRCLRLESS